jgi:GGDEF domain-containing protein
MEEALEALRTSWRVVVGTDPSYEAIVALLTAWNETTLGYLHQLSCEDPLTGLASQAHLRTRLAELYRAEMATMDGSSVPTGMGPAEAAEFALVMCSVPWGDDPSDEQGDHFTRAMRLTRMGEMARTVFSRNETIARLGSRSVAVLVPRDARLGRRVRVLRTLLSDLEVDGPPARVWIEGLPRSDTGAVMLLDELARG